MDRILGNDQFASWTFPFSTNLVSSHGIPGVSIINISEDHGPCLRGSPGSAPGSDTLNISVAGIW